ncbi:MAG: hypothetical protein NVSMB8_02630 [Candidatus Limnocylindrales bacterium]
MNGRSCPTFNVFPAVAAADAAALGAPPLVDAGAQAAASAAADAVTRNERRDIR